MNWQALLCIILHAFRLPRFINRVALPVSFLPANGFLRDMGRAPALAVNFNGATGRINGRVEGSSDTLFPANLNATISGEFRHDFAISLNDIVGGSEHELQARMTFTGVFKHKVSEYASPGLHLGPVPTNALTRSEIVTIVQVFENGVAAPLASDISQPHNEAFDETSSDGPVMGGLQLLVPVIRPIALTTNVNLRFTPTGTRNLVVRVRMVVRASARGASAEILVGQSATDTSFNGAVAGSMTATIDRLRYRVAVDPDGACADIIN